MGNPAVQAVTQTRTQALTRDVALVVGGSLLMALLARFSMPLPFTPVYLSLSNLGVLLIALTLGSRRGAAALLLYLAEGAMGLPVFSNGGPGGLVQLLGPTGGYLLAYPVAAFVGGWIAERNFRSVARLCVAALTAEVLLFVGGITWLVMLTHVPLQQAANWGVYPFAFAEIVKIMTAVSSSAGLHRSNTLNNFLGL
jgi:biotin transport system substrate-specific component